MPGWRKAPTKLPFGRWKLRFGRWKSFWPTRFGRWKYLSAENLCRLKFASSVWISPLLINVSSQRLESFTTHTTEMTQHVLEEICAQAIENNLIELEITQACFEWKSCSIVIKSKAYNSNVSLTIGDVPSNYHAYHVSIEIDAMIKHSNWTRKSPLLNVYLCHIFKTMWMHGILVGS